MVTNDQGRRYPRKPNASSGWKCLSTRLRIRDNPSAKFISGDAGLTHEHHFTAEMPTPRTSITLHKNTRPIIAWAHTTTSPYVRCNWPLIAGAARAAKREARVQNCSQAHEWEFRLGSGRTESRNHEWEFCLGSGRTEAGDHEWEFSLGSNDRKQRPRGR